MHMYGSRSTTFLSKDLDDACIDKVWHCSGSMQSITMEKQGTMNLSENIAGIPPREYI